MKIKELLTDETKWTKGSFAKDKYCTAVFATSSNAICWCLSGAMIKCYSGDEYISVSKLVSNRLRRLSFGDIIKFNDDSEITFENVRNLIEGLDI